MLGASKVALLTLGLVGLVSFQYADAYCPNGCNAQGTCGKNDKCTCYLRQDEGESFDYPAFIGPDCSMRTCPFGTAWVAVPKPVSGAAITVGHHKTECSNRGLCDYGSGVCSCFPGYEGKACERTVCPNNCNGRGVCMTLKAIIKGAPVPAGGIDYDAWDAEKHMGCFCDLGYRGPDCSLKECPSGPDVLLADGNEQGRDCGGRGRCNYEAGECECFPGYYGTTCDSQTTVG